jgi:hypothetical protein
MYNEDVDLTIRSEVGSGQVAAGISFVSSPKRSPKRTAITLHEELAITPTWRVNCQMVRSGQPTGVLIPVVSLFGGEIGAKNVMVMLVQRTEITTRHKDKTILY